MEGLDVTVQRLSEARKENPSFRVNSEYFCKEAMRAAALVTTCENLPVSAIVDGVQHPVELTREYDDHGLLIMLAQNVRDNRIEFGDAAYMSESRRPLLAPNRLNVGDVLMTRSGANYGQSAPWKFATIEAFACADLLVFRSAKIPTGYLSSFLSSCLGKTLIERGVYGMAQPHIAPSYLLRMRVPRFGKLEKIIDETVDAAIVEQQRATALLNEAEEALAAALGLRDWQPPEPLTYTQRASEALAARRLDAEYFAPHVGELIARLGASGRTVGDVSPARHERFVSGREGEFHYIEISDVHSDGTASSTRLPQCDAPSRATQFVRARDVITSTVRPIRGLSAIVSSEQGGHVCSSGFVVLEPRAVASEVLFTYLRHPLICELMDLHTSASMYPAISETDLLRLPFPEIGGATSKKIVAAVTSAHASRRRARELLEAATRAIKSQSRIAKALRYAFWNAFLVIKDI